MAAEEEVLRKRNAASAEDGPVPTLFPISCCSHSAVLTQKPLLTTIPSLSTILVKLGHLLESGRVQEKFEAALDAILDNDHNFEFIEYLDEASLPEGFFDWAAERDALLVLTAGACDLQEDEVQLDNMIDNCSWRLSQLQHHCVKGKCELGCNG